MGRLGAAACTITSHFVQLNFGRTCRITLKRAGTYSSISEMSSPNWRKRPPFYEQSTANGATLEDHWKRGLALQRIREGNWDYIVLQDHSEGPTLQKNDFIKYATLLDQEIKKAGAKTLLFMTWPKAREPAKLTELAVELYGADRLSAACVGREEDRFRQALAPVSEALVAA